MIDHALTDDRDPRRAQISEGETDAGRSRPAEMRRRAAGRDDAGAEREQPGREETSGDLLESERTLNPGRTRGRAKAGGRKGRRPAHGKS